MPLYLPHQRMSKIQIIHLKKFIQESNEIEWEWDRQDSVENLREFLSKPITKESLFEYHKSLWPDFDWTGKYRETKVYIGEHIPPKPEHVALHMESWFERLPLLGSWEAHNEFEKIHPFRDFNGRLGRAIWLHKALKKGYDFKLSFLHTYYYQTLHYMSKDA